MPDGMGGAFMPCVMPNNQHFARTDDGVAHRLPWQSPALQETALPDITAANCSGVIADDPFSCPTS